MASSHYYAVSALFNGLFGAFIVYYIYLKNRTNPINRSFVYLGIAISGWSLIYSLWGWAQDQQTAEFYLRRHMMFCAFIPAAFLHFSAHFTQNYERFKRYIFIAYILAVFYSLGMLTPYMIAGTKEVMCFKYWPHPGLILPSHVVYFFILCGTAFYLMGRYYLQSEGAERAKAGWVFCAFLIGFGGGSINWLLWFDIPIPPTTNFFVGIMFTMIAYAMVRYGLMDVDTFLEILRSSRAASLGLVSSMINHEMRNPLYVAKGRIECQLDSIERKTHASPEEEAQESREALKKAHEQLTRAMDIMQRFSDFAKPSAHDKKEKVVLSDLWTEVLQMVEREFEVSRIRVDVQPTNGLTVAANRRQLEEIFFNLVLNAGQALAAEGRASFASFNVLPEACGLEPAAAKPCIAISAERTNGHVNVTISDNGPGISKEIQHRIFDPFFSTKPTTGTGLGLYIAKQLTERNGGRISVQSRPGQGTQFTLELLAS